MIKMLRLDERLIHGQVAIKWSRHLKVDRIVVANDEASKNEVIQKSLLLAAPQNIKVAIKDVDFSIKLLNDPRMSKVNALVIVDSPQDLLKIVKNVENISKINIGNYGRVAEKKEGIQRKSYGPNLYLYDDERDILREVLSYSSDVTYQTTPEDVPEKLSKLLERGE